MIFQDIKKFLYTLPKVNDIYPILKNKNAYEIKKIEKNNFLKIDEKKVEGEVWAVDGSNKTIAESSGKALELVRIAAVSSQEKIKTATFIVGVVPQIQNNELYYVAKAFRTAGTSISMQDVKIDAYDPSITGSAFKAQPSAIAAVVRRFLEWVMIKHILKEKPSIVLKDGSLAMNITGEKNIALEAVKSNIPLIGIVKRSTILSNRGLNILKEITKIQPKGKWVYHYVAKGIEEEHQAYINIIKLHEKGRAYRAEISTNYDPAETYAHLTALSNDALYLGYPYLLAKADKIAKIKDHEVKNLMLSLVEKEEFEEDMHEIFSKEW